MAKELLAPNGKPSNLTTEQYKLVRTPAFKKWFGDWENDPDNASKVIDENGEPLIVYHGRSSDFAIFSDRYAGKYTTETGKLGFFFTNSFDLAKMFTKTKWASPTSKQRKGANIIEVFLNIKNPKTIDGRQFTLINNPFDYRLRQIQNNFDGIIINPMPEEDIESWLRIFGSRGIEEFKATQYVSFYSNQIKLADGTNTTFDSSNDDIRFEKGGRTIAQTPAPKKDQIKGSDINKKSSSKDLSSAKLIKFDDKTIVAIKNKVKEHNAENPDKKINLSSAKAVVRRGMGAYSKSYRPTISGGKPNSRLAWGLARLNAFTYKIVNGKSKSGKYSQDDDLINELGFKVANYNNGGEMSKDIRCINCGWEWNKKDSELWDMYVCHKCGFDNTTFYTSIPINNYSRGGQTERTNPDYLKMFLDL
jgi:hypothetical protein